MPDLNLGTLSVEPGSFDDGGAIPVAYTAAGDGTSPALRWSGVPGGTVELALVVHDPDAPLTDGFTHWVVTGIDPSSGGVPEGGFEEGTVVEGLNETGEVGYTGPAPPPGHGPHHYFFHLYAVDRPLGDQPLTRAALLDRLEGHVIEQARTVGTFEA